MWSANNTMHNPRQPSQTSRSTCVEADGDYIHILDVERVLQMDNFMEDGVWVTCSDYRQATADPLRDFADHLVHEINTHNMEDVLRFCNIFVDSDVQVSEAKMVWVDRLGFDVHLYSPQNDVFEVRIPFPREVTNEKGAKSSFNVIVDQHTPTLSNKALHCVSTKILNPWMFAKGTVEVDWLAFAAQLELVTPLSDC
ncbi:hypothetical protein E3N88_21518 [Mikania micrantha]|uniref:DUF2470 domain-containing protein n=1 Tax=Mikania micrantha TaxID=192012 RepID=A0A5N6NMI4_9ASTR|nr:hypothetical protein E3N88_21518 [Mikania micrantha]